MTSAAEPVDLFCNSKSLFQVIGINGRFPGPILNVTTNWNVVVNVKNELDEPLLLTWYDICLSFQKVQTKFGNTKTLMLMLLTFDVGMVYNIEKIPGKMVFQVLIVRFLLDGIGHISFR